MFVHIVDIGDSEPWRYFVDELSGKEALDTSVAMAWEWVLLYVLL